MHYTTIATDNRDGIDILTLDRPDRMNAFDIAMANELEDYFRAVDGNDSVDAVVVTGAGRAFCAGMDLRAEGNVFGLDEVLTPSLQELTERSDDPEIVAGVRDTGGRVTLAIHDCSKPVIAAINGVAVGIGATMMLAMDFRLAAENAALGFVFGRIGIVPEACSSWFLPRLVGLQTALEWMLTAEIIPAAEAHRAGLIRSLHPSETLIDEAVALARRIVTNRSPAAIAVTRQMLRRNPALPSPFEAHLVESLGVLHTQRRDGQEGIAAFLEKRTPAFTSQPRDLDGFYPWWTK